MGYGCVISLKQTIQRLLDSSKFTVDSSTREILGFAYKEATSLQQLLGDCDGGDKRRLDRLDGQIRETVHKLEDFLELHQSDLFLDEDNLSIHSERVRQEINWFSERVKKLGEDYGAEADEEEDDAAPASSSNTGFCEEMVGFSDDLSSMKQHVTSTLRPDDWGIMLIVGAAGSGRSLAAKKVLDDVMSRGELCFDYGVWVSVGPKYERERILQLILSEILKIDNGGVAGSEEQHKRCLWSRLEGRRYMIVLDDVCDTDIFDYLINLFPVQNNGSVVLVTTGSMVVRNHVGCYAYWMSNENVQSKADESWDLLRLVLFGTMNAVPPELKKAGRKIVRNCRGLRLCMLKVLLYLWSAERSPEAWNEIAFDHHHPLFQIADEFLERRKNEEVRRKEMAMKRATDIASSSSGLERVKIRRERRWLEHSSILEPPTAAHTCAGAQPSALLSPAGAHSCATAHQSLRHVEGARAQENWCARVRTTPRARNSTFGLQRTRARICARARHPSEPRARTFSLIRPTLTNLTYFFDLGL